MSSDAGTPVDAIETVEAGKPEDGRAAATLVATLSGLLITAALAVLGAQAVIATFIIDNRQRLFWFYTVSGIGTATLILSIICGGLGIDEIASAGFRGKWQIRTRNGVFNWQAVLALVGTVLVVGSAFLGHDKIAQPFPYHYVIPGLRRVP